MARLASTLAALLIACASLTRASNARNARSNLLYLEKQFSQSFTDGYNTLKHVGGNGPYSDRSSYGIDRDPPAGCTVGQVIMIHRHGERYPAAGVGAAIESSLAKIRRAKISKYEGDLSFLDDWEYFVTEPYYELETFSGPYAGLLDAYNRGTQYRARYGHLWDGNEVIPIFTSDFERVIETSRKFGEGFFQYNYSASAAINIISESEKEGANSLTPTCIHDDDTAVCNALGSGLLLPQFDVAAARLNEQNPGINVNASDVFNLMTMAGFELNARPYSDWINAFTLDEWVAFGYTQDLQYYYCAGPGDKNMRAVGAVYANASLSLLKQGPSAGTMFWNFAHDTNITPILTALGLVTPSEDLPLDRIPFGNPWRVGDITPMGTHLVLERLSCNATAATPEGTYVRAVLNEAVLPFDTCQSGPGYSCSLSNYTSLMSRILPDFVQTCGIPASYPQYLSFWWDYNTTTALNYRNGSVPYQGSS